MSGNEVWVTGFSKLKGKNMLLWLATLMLMELLMGSTGATALGDLASFMQDSPVLENTQAFQAKYSLMDSFFRFHTRLCW